MKTKCLWKDRAERELEAMKRRGDKDDSVTQGYKDRGCYECNGFDLSCEKYLPRVPTREEKVVYYGY